jgi:hypothetical protein
VAVRALDTDTLTKEEIERRTFEHLAQIAGLLVVPGSIRQAKPPAPDIECELQDGGPLGVELVALDAPLTRTRLNNMQGTHDAWQRALARRSAAEQLQLDQRCKDVFLSLNIKEDAGSRQRTTIMTWIQDQVLSLPPGFTGPLFGSDGPSGLHRAAVHRGHVTNGPRINAPSGGSWLYPQIEKLKDKLTNKTYRINAPLDLFAYSTHDELDGHIDSLAEIETCIKTHLANSPFRKVYVFNAGFSSLVYQYPP